MFGGGGAPRQQPDAEGVFADVFEEAYILSLFSAPQFIPFLVAKT